MGRNDYIGPRFIDHRAYSGVGGCAPKLRKDKLAVVIIEVPIRHREIYYYGDSVPGKIWRKRMVVSFAPILRADLI